MRRKYDYTEIKKEIEDLKILLMLKYMTLLSIN